MSKRLQGIGKASKEQLVPCITEEQGFPLWARSWDPNVDKDENTFRLLMMDNASQATSQGSWPRDASSSPWKYGELSIAVHARGHDIGWPFAGEASCYLGLEIKRNRAALSASDRLDCRCPAQLQHGSREPANSAAVLGTAEKAAGCLTVTQRIRRANRGLQFAAHHSRPDLAHATGVLARFIADPSDQHWAATRGVLERALRGDVKLSDCPTDCNSLHA
eukprot:1145242-Pelagomonas_calceolata.AAC.1